MSSDAREKIIEVLEAMGLSINAVDDQVIANAMQSMLMMLDMQDDMIEELSTTLINERAAEENYFVQINDYCRELEHDVNELSSRVVELESNKLCSCDVVSNTMKMLQ